MMVSRALTEGFQPIKGDTEEPDEPEDPIIRERYELLAQEYQ